eukprot:767509-Pyramimonas_sp.AAC.1
MRHIDVTNGDLVRDEKSGEPPESRACSEALGNIPRGANRRAANHALCDASRGHALKFQS